MDSREPPQPAPTPAMLHHQRQQFQHQMMSAYTSSMINHNHVAAAAAAAAGGNHNQIPNPNSAAGAGFPFNSVGLAPQPPRPLPQQPPPPRPQPKQASDGGGGVFDGSSPPPSGMGFSMEPAKKKRGRPRKYAPDGNIALGLSPTGISSSGGTASVGYGDSGGGGGGTPGSLSEPAPKRNRGRPPGSVKKQLDALGGVGGVGFTPHVITVNAGEDVAAKIMAFAQQGPRTLCILSANGAVCDITLRQPTTSGGAISFEGRYEIISLSGTFLFSQESGNRRIGGLSVSLAASDGQVVGGPVAGSLKAASTVLVVVGSFVADGKKSNSSVSKPVPSTTPAPQMLNFGAPVKAASPPSQGVSSESSDGNGSSPLNRTPAFYGNSSQAMHNLPMYLPWGQNPQ